MLIYFKTGDLKRITTYKTITFNKNIFSSEEKNIWVLWFCLKNIKMSSFAVLAVIDLTINFIKTISKIFPCCFPNDQHQISVTFYLMKLFIPLNCLWSWNVWQIEQSTLVNRVNKKFGSQQYFVFHHQFYCVGGWLGWPLDCCNKPC
jgi:hypothetical protein